MRINSNFDFDQKVYSTCNQNVKETKNKSIAQIEFSFVGQELSELAPYFLPQKSFRNQVGASATSISMTKSTLLGS